MSNTKKSNAKTPRKDSRKDTKAKTLAQTPEVKIEYNEADYLYAVAIDAYDAENEKNKVIPNKTKKFRAMLEETVNSTEAVEFEDYNNTTCSNAESSYACRDDTCCIVCPTPNSKKSVRVIECWIHAKRIDIRMPKKLVAKLIEAEDKLIKQYTDDEVYIAEANRIKKYEKMIDVKARDSKYVYRFDDVCDAVEYCNIVMQLV